MSYLILDNAVPEYLVNSAIQHFPDPAWHQWFFWNTTTSRKKGSRSPLEIHPVFLEVFHAMAKAIENKAGYSEYWRQSLAESGPDFDLHGAGLSLLEDGGFINVHTDAASHPTRDWERTHSAILYLDDLETGHTTFNEPETHLALVAVRPKRNRLLIFETDSQFHGAARCDRVRRSVNLFYWRPSQHKHASQRSDFSSTLPVIEPGLTEVIN